MMHKLIHEYRRLSFEQKTAYSTIAGLCFSAILASGKLVIGLFTDFNLCVIAVYTFAILLSKLECLLGIKSAKRSSEARNSLIAAFLFIASLLYIGFMCRMLFYERSAKENSIVYVLSVALISFVELGFAITGILRTKRRGHFYRNIKIINFCMVLISILTTQMTILDFAATESTDTYNALAGIGIGVFIALCALYILLIPKIGITGKEYNVFVLNGNAESSLIDAKDGKIEILLCRSRVYGSYVYRASVKDKRVDGYIEQDKSLWTRMHIFLKILCCVLSEILIFAWLIGRLVFFLRSINLPKRLERKMNACGYEKATAIG